MQRAAVQLARRQGQVLLAEPSLRSLDADLIRVRGTSTRHVDAASPSAATGPSIVEPPAATGGEQAGGRYRYGRWIGAALLPVAAGTAAVTHQQHESALQAPPPVTLLSGPPYASEWVQSIADTEGVQQVLTADSMQHHHPALKPDHMFSALLRHELVKDLVCFYDKENKKFSYVIQLGSDVCGYPRIVHGGLTAAIMDESFGFLFYAMRHHSQLNFWAPAFTAHLEVNFKAKIQAGKLLLCETELESMEGRKLWMKATVRDSPNGKVYANARALFVVPRTSRLVTDGVKYVMHRMFPAKVSLE